MRLLYRISPWILLAGVLALVLTSCGEEDEPLLPSSVSLNRTALTLSIGSSEQLTATVLPEKTADKSLLWHSGNSTVVSVDGNGTVTALEAGIVIITVKTYKGEVSSQCVVTVLADPIAVASVSLDRTSADIAVGDLLTLQATVLPADATNKTLVWSSSKTSVATVDENGQIYAISPGVAVVTVVTHDGLKTASCIVNVAATSYVGIAAGNFTMGSAATEIGRSLEEVERKVVLSAFQMSKHEITNAQYSAFLNEKSIGASGKWNEATFDPSQVLVFDSSKDGRSNWGVNYDSAQGRWKPASGKENFPVVYVTWFGAIEFARWAGGDLPTEAQWEYACKGNKSALPFGLGNGKRLDGLAANIAGKGVYDLDLGGDQPWDESLTQLDATCVVGLYAANSYELYDMHGNVTEWCKDWYGGYPTSQPSYTNPQGVTYPMLNALRVMRGGSYLDKALLCRSAHRKSASPNGEMAFVGFRVVLASV